MKHFLLAGLFGLFLLQFAYTLGSQRTVAANAGVITLTIPVFVAVAGAFLLNEKLNAVRVSGFLLGVLITSVSDLRASDFRHGNFVINNLIFLLACAACGFYNAYCKLLVMRSYTELEILVYTSVIGSVASIPLFPGVEPFHFSSLATAVVLGHVELSFIVYRCSN